MVKTLYANGCSFTAGIEIPLPPHLQNPWPTAQQRRRRTAPTSAVSQYQRERAWPRVLGDRLGAECVVNEARGGGSNARAFRMTYLFVSTYLEDGGSAGQLFVCLGLTDPVRYERYESRLKQREYDFDGGWEIMKPRMPTTSSRHAVTCADAYYRYVHSEVQTTLALAQQLVALQFWLDGLGVPFYVHDATERNVRSLNEHYELISPLVRLLKVERFRSLRSSRKAGLHFDSSLSFEAWACAGGYPFGLGGHPLTDAHRAWGELLCSEIQELGLVTTTASS